MSPELRRDPDFSREVLEDLYRYRRKRRSVAWALWVVSGFLGGHRFYLNRTGTGLAMLLTGGGGLVWWLVDAFLLTRMVDSYNREQAQREKGGLPPVALDFMPALRTAALDEPPEWAAARGGRLRLIGDALVLVVAGSALGNFSASTGEYEALIAILALIAITNLGARWHDLARLPLLRQLDRWSHRLRLFYHYNDPGGPLSLLVRPLFGVLYAPFRKRARAETRLYLQLGAVFAIVFTLLDLGAAVTVTGGGLDISVLPLVQDLILAFVSVYAFAAPIGAILTAHLLLERTDLIVWTLSGLSLGAIALGLFGG